MNKLFTLLILCSTFSFGQYIKKATFVLSDGKKMEVEDVFYGDKVYEYKLKKNKSSNQAIIKEDVSEIIFDSIDFIATIEQKEYFDIKNKYYENDLPEGVYQTIADFYKKIPSSTQKITGVESGINIYSNPKDLMTFKYSSNNSTLKKEFAVVFEGNLYIGIHGIDKYESKKMKGGFAINHSMNRYVKVKYATDDYYYIEMSLIPAGQAITKMAVGSYYGTTYNLDNNMYPVILNNKEQNFYIVKNCKRFNEYFSTNLNLSISCEKENDFLNDVRMLMIKD